jgi:hypothetical protein
MKRNYLLLMAMALLAIPSMAQKNSTRRLVKEVFCTDHYTLKSTDTVKFKRVDEETDYNQTVVVLDIKDMDEVHSVMIFSTAWSANKLARKCQKIRIMFPNGTSRDVSRRLIKRHNPDAIYLVDDLVNR